MREAPQRKTRPRIVVAGAGSIGCFVGGMLAEGGHDVTLLLRAATREELSKHGLLLTDFAGMDTALSPDQFAMDTDPACLAGADIVLLTVKSAATAEMAAQIARHAPQGAVVVSLQNGVQNAPLLHDLLPEFDVRAGMVPFNVLWVGGGRFHRGTSGDICIAKGKGHVARHLSLPGLQVHEHKNMAAVQWGKLLINLNNALNALSGLPLRKQIGDMRWRRLMAAQMVEALDLLRAEGIATVNPVAAVPMRCVPVILRLPTWAFRWVAKAMLSIDPNARSSMWENLDRGRMTEIEELQGKIVALAADQGTTAPINSAIAELIREAEAAGAGAPVLSPREVRQRLRAA
ncbi:2-dehydropantoate 2-reductase [Shimia marina]|uniref:2-dehydropantoate 2-reductase n=1 Tax=Shimia marina TaxID=321267 RepID=A0A0P1FBZ0_9RHOB|nr:2-dehydropantoate 2-reductase [Shimia marina]CUH54187.1 2-dehydropantoate 2-reductase [Shimia marina]SFD97294.1 2-dehydropantoate 2-reductase [Shimia marina]